MCTDESFDELNSSFVTGPTHKTRWIYSSSKQLLDRVIYAYGEKGLSYTLFRPFNWIGPKLDSIVNKVGGSRVVTQFLSNIIHGHPITLVGGGAQRRCFTDIDDAINALIKIIELSQSEAKGRIFNIGNPGNNFSIKELAEMVVDAVKQYPEYAERAKSCKIINVDPVEHFGAGYQDLAFRVPSIEQARKYLQWQPSIGLQESIKKILDFHLG
jgi:nucleoside-diphosphate-sugar epimerase